MRELSPSAGELSGLVSVGLGEYLSVRELAGAISLFQDEYPKVRFALRSGSNADFLEGMTGGTIDVALLLEPFDDEALDRLPMGAVERWGALAPIGMSMPSQYVIRPGDLAAHRVVTVQSDATIQREFMEWSGEHTQQMDWYAHYNGIYNAAIFARERCSAVVCLEHDCSFEGMRFLPFDPPLEHGTALARRSDRLQPEPVRTFIRFMRAHGASRQQ